SLSVAAAELDLVRSNAPSEVSLRCCMRCSARHPHSTRGDVAVLAPCLRHSWDVAALHLAYIDHAHGDRNSWAQSAGICDSRVEHCLECCLICFAVHIRLVRRLGSARLAHIVA